MGPKLTVSEAIAAFTESESEISLTLAHGGDAVVSYEFESVSDLNSFLLGVAKLPRVKFQREVWYLTRSLSSSQDGN